jgi:hypothetical protein
MKGRVAGPVRRRTSSSSHRGRLDSGGLVGVVNGGLAGVGGVYATTHSVVITVVAGVVAIVLALMVLLFHR